MKNFILTITVLFSTLIAEDTFCSQTLRLTTVVNREISSNNDGYKASVILRVPVEYNQWLLDYYSLEEIVYVRGNGNSDDLNFAMDIAELDARGNAACLYSEEIRVLFTVVENSWKKKSFFKKLFGK